MTAASSPSLGRTFVKSHRNTAQNLRKEFLKVQIWSLGTPFSFNVKFLQVSNPNKKNDMIPSVLSIPCTTNTVYQVPTENYEFFHEDHQGFAGQAGQTGSSACLTQAAVPASTSICVTETTKQTEGACTFGHWHIQVSQLMDKRNSVCIQSCCPMGLDIQEFGTLPLKQWEWKTRARKEVEKKKSVKTTGGKVTPNIL